MAEQDFTAKPADKRAGLHFVALEEADLAVISAHLQDSIVRIADMAYLPRERRFALLCQRFDWLASEQGCIERCQAGLHFDAVRHVRFAGFDLTKKDRILNLLSIVFEPSELPAGEVVLTFSAGGAIRLEVDCIEAQMADLDLRWKARHKPGHELGDDDSG